MKNYKFMIICAMLFNIADAFFTYYFIKNDLAVELNPIMNVLIGFSCELFVFVKILISCLFVILWIGINKKMARIGVVVIFLTYLLIIINHLRYFIIN
jgi:hypothetical protein